MELLNIDKFTKLYDLSVSGNSIIRVLNDYEDGLIDKNYITYDNNSFKIKAYNTNNFYLNGKFYAKLSYINKTPTIDCIWNYDNFTPSHVVYPITEIKQSTLDQFNIKNYCMKINYDEIKKNIDLLDSENNKFRHLLKSRKKYSNNKYTNSIKFYPRTVQILSENFIESSQILSNDHSNTSLQMDEINLCDSDSSSYDSLAECNVENRGFQDSTDAFVFDEMQ